MIQLFENVYKTTNVELRDYSCTNFLAAHQKATIYVENSRTRKVMFIINYDNKNGTTVQDRFYDKTTPPYYIQNFLDK